MSKTALVTGSSRGIGKACALKLAELGYDIAVNCNSNLEMAQKAVDEITSLGRKAVAYKANTADIDEVKDMFRSIQQDFGGIDVLVNNAGVVDDAYLLMIKDESLERSLDINIKGYFNCARQASLKMLRKKSGIIINISSGMPFIISVSIKPGATAFTLIPYFASSFASVCVIAFTAPFVAL